MYTIIKCSAANLLIASDLILRLKVKRAIRIFLIGHKGDQWYQTLK